MQFLQPLILLPFINLFLLARNTHALSLVPRATCTIIPSLNGSDDAPAILAAFEECGDGGTVVFENYTYTINSVMNTTGLKDCDVEIRGTLLWSTNITYWLDNSMPIGYQNQSTAWFLGGDNINVNGYGYGTLDGNGQTWYDFVKGVSNYPNRPHGLTIWGSTNSVFQGLRFVQSQMWTMSIMHSNSVLLQNIYVNSTSSDGYPARNTDGADTIYSKNITFDQWTVINGDDSISTKANSTNILITNSTFYKGLGVAIGSIGQYKDVFETIENVTARNIVFYDTLHGGYIKTWTGEQVGYPPNGGGGGWGYAKNITFEDFTFTSLTGSPFTITQCTTFSGMTGNCTSSEFQISNLNINNINGSIINPIADYSCSGVAPCMNITMTDLDLVTASGAAAAGYNCTNVEGTVGFVCEGAA